MKIKKIILLPVFNEEMFIEKVLEDCLKYSDILIVIDDGSTDASWAKIQDSAKNNLGFIYYRIEKNSGKGSALRLGFQIVNFLMEQGVVVPDDCLITIDADGQHGLQDIEKLVNFLLSNGVDLVLARRLFAGYPLLKKWGNIILSWHASVLGGIKYFDSESGFRCMRVKVVRALLPFFCGFRYSDSHEIVIIAARLGFRINNSFISEAIYYRKGGTSIFDGIYIVLLGFICLLRIKLKKMPVDSKAMELDKRIVKIISAQLSVIGCFAGNPRISTLRKLRIMLIYPPGPMCIREDRCQVPLKGMLAANSRPPIDLAIIAALLSENTEIFLKDYPAEGALSDVFVSDLYLFNPDYCVVQLTHPTFYDDIKMCQLAKRISPNLVIIGKGPVFLLQAKLILEKNNCLDIAVVGEPERGIKDILDGKPWNEIKGIVFRKGEEIFANPPRGFEEDLDSLPFPDRRFIKNELYRSADSGDMQTVVHVQRGCPYNCIFCLSGVVSGNIVRYRSVNNTIEEIEECVNRFKINKFFLKADSFTINREWVCNFCAEIKKRGLKIGWLTNSRADALDEEVVRLMKDAGCNGLAIGIESANQKTLDRIGKKINIDNIFAAGSSCKKYGLRIAAMFIIGWPWENEQDIRATIYLAKKLNAAVSEFNFLTPFPGTPIYAECLKDGLVKESFICAYNYSTKAMGSKKLTSDKLKKIRVNAYLAYYFRLRYVLENVFPNITSARDFARFFNYGIRKLASII